MASIAKSTNPSCTDYLVRIQASYPSGVIKYSCTYFYGHKHGEEKFYHQNGKVQSLVKYNYGTEVEDMIRWNEKGELIY